MRQIEHSREELACPSSCLFQAHLHEMEPSWNENAESELGATTGHRPVSEALSNSARVNQTVIFCSKRSILGELDASVCAWRKVWDVCSKLRLVVKCAYLLALVFDSIATFLLHLLVWGNLSLSHVFYILLLIGLFVYLKFFIAEDFLQVGKVKMGQGRKQTSRSKIELWSLTLLILKNCSYSSEEFRLDLKD